MLRTRVKSKDKVRKFLVSCCWDQGGMKALLLRVLCAWNSMQIVRIQSFLVCEMFAARAFLNLLAGHCMYLNLHALMMIWSNGEQKQSNRKLLNILVLPLPPSTFFMKNWKLDLSPHLSIDITEEKVTARHSIWGEEFFAPSLVSSPSPASSVSSSSFFPSPIHRPSVNSQTSKAGEGRKNGVVKNWGISSGLSSLSSHSPITNEEKVAQNIVTFSSFASSTSPISFPPLPPPIASGPASLSFLGKKNGNGGHGEKKSRFRSFEVNCNRPSNPEIECSPFAMVSFFFLLPLRASSPLLMIFLLQVHSSIVVDLETKLEDKQLPLPQLFEFMYKLGTILGTWESRSFHPSLCFTLAFLPSFCLCCFLLFESMRISERGSKPERVPLFFFLFVFPGNNLRRHWHQHQLEFVRCWGRKSQEQKIVVLQECTSNCFAALFQHAFETIAVRYGLPHLTNRQLMSLLQFHVAEAAKDPKEIDAIGLMRTYAGGDLRWEPQSTDESRCYVCFRLSFIHCLSFSLYASFLKMGGSRSGDGSNV